MPTLVSMNGLSVLVDEEDYEWAKNFKWSAHPTAGVKMAGFGKELPTYLMHRAIMGLEHGDIRMVDHINHNRLNNRRNNLRICDGSQNQANQRKTLEITTSKYKGVS